MLVVTTCSKPPDYGHVYDHRFWDSTGVQISADSVTVLLEEHLVIGQQESLRVVMQPAPTLVDSVRLKFEVYGQSQHKTPHPFKFIATYADTIFLWYAAVPYDSVHTNPQGMGKIMHIQSPPLPPDHYFLDSLIIFHPSAMQVDFAHKLLGY